MAYRALSKLNEAVSSVLETYPMWYVFVRQYKLKVVIKQGYLWVGFFIARNMKRWNWQPYKADNIHA